ncbi:hypothetical protein [Endozoicomonas sp. GU-1]|uniref:hypothetical protein n=1 Tax=Endozoicomonas sp. GU-1 TaxID=3009078 RepID=UPI0022B2EC28|nr:hypothetical protein [Endozoicomonas sp. GU-1]WBA82462.1 hypothetical protein O2T12_04750 [Endozoicomonas sp. GU-1]WBA85395.1 hypothetical protein O3276_19425 [Endozoicomonas sp. GU-1]
MLRVVERLVGKKQYVCLLIMLSYSSGSNAWFNFVDPSPDPIQLDWADQDITVEIPFLLQSCFGTGPFTCTIARTVQTYYLQASDFNLTYDNSNGTDNTPRTIAEAIFKQANNTDNLVNGQRYGRFNPGDYNSVPATVTFKVLNNQLYDALPGTYSANVVLNGLESDGFIQDDDQTQFKFDIVIPKRVKISGLRNIELKTTGYNAVNSGWYSFCIFSQGGTAFNLKAQGANDSNNFVLKQGSELIDYELWIKSAGSTESQIIPMTNYQNWSGSIDKDCKSNSKNNMELEVRIQSDSLTNTSAGVYKDTVTIIVEAV